MRYLLLSLCILFGLSACEKGIVGIEVVAAAPAPDANPSGTVYATITATAVPTTENPSVAEAPAVKPAEVATATDLEELRIQKRIGYCSIRQERVDCETKIRRWAAIEKVLAKDVATNCVTIETNMIGGPYREVCKIQVGQMTQTCYIITDKNEYPVDCTFYKAIHDRVADLEK